MKRIGFVINPDKSSVPQLTAEFSARARKAGVATRVTRAFPVPRRFLRECDACVVIGGDGTLLGAVQEAAANHCPVIGINQGSLGFLTTFTIEEARAQFESLLQGGFALSERSLLSCRVGRGRVGLALNDIVIKDLGNVRMLRLAVHADGELVTDYFCDGLIICSPTGSTAYNLSAGGPIVHPGASVLVMTPICPHTLSNRTLIFRDGVTLRVVNRTAGGNVLVALDGHRNLFAAEASPVEISMAKEKLLLAQKPAYSHFEVVRTKLQWHGSYVRERGRSAQ